ncbi:hypothetical protein RRG08_000269 [Elysia crispata]|uniref:Uncharacterized protein n=1 Tax=Elysia crispata TaxID=231223 RepID=A0AAE1EBG8_9GAST|nr:hypothetical protein RRG08_000269 [Elysia crispata]
MSGPDQCIGYGMGGSWQGIMIGISGPGQGIGYGMGGTWQGIINGMSGPGQGIGYGLGGTWQGIVYDMSGPGQGIGYGMATGSSNFERRGDSTKTTKPSIVVEDSLLIGCMLATCLNRHLQVEMSVAVGFHSKPFGHTQVRKFNWLMSQPRFASMEEVGLDFSTWNTVLITQQKNILFEGLTVCFNGYFGSPV